MHGKKQNKTNTKTLCKLMKWPGTSLSWTLCGCDTIYTLFGYSIWIHVHCVFLVCDVFCFLVCGAASLILITSSHHLRLLAPACSTLAPSPRPLPPPPLNLTPGWSRFFGPASTGSGTWTEEGHRSQSHPGPPPGPASHRQTRCWSWRRLLRTWWEDSTWEANRGGFTAHDQGRSLDSRFIGTKYQESTCMYETITWNQLKSVFLSTFSAAKLAQLNVSSLAL